MSYKKSWGWGGAAIKQFAAIGYFLKQVRVSSLSSAFIYTSQVYITTNYLLSTYSMTQPYNEERKLILQPATQLLASLNKTSCPSKPTQCLPTKACWPQGRTPRGHSHRPTDTDTRARAQHVWMERCQVRTSERQRSVSISVRVLQGICLSASFSVEKAAKARKVSDSVTLKIQS